MTATRPILSYPTDAGTWDEPRPFATGTFADFVHPDDRCDAHTTITRPDINSVREALAEPQPFTVSAPLHGPKEPNAETAARLLGIITKPADTPKDPPMPTRSTPICHKTIAPVREPYETALGRASDCIGSNCSLWHASDALPGCGRCSEAPHATPWPDPFTQEEK